MVSVVKWLQAYTDDTPYTPTWQEKITGVKADIAIATAREFADNAEKRKVVP